MSSFGPIHNPNVLSTCVAPTQELNSSPHKSSLPNGSSGGYQTTTKVILSFLSFCRFLQEGAIPFRNLTILSKGD